MGKRNGNFRSEKREDKEFRKEPWRYFTSIDAFQTHFLDSLVFSCPREIPILSRETNNICFVTTRELFL